VISEHLNINKLLAMNCRYFLKLVLFFLLISKTACPCPIKGIGYVDYIKGTVNVVRGDEKFTIKCGTVIKTGDLIETDKNSRVIIKFHDGTSISIGEESKVQITKKIVSLKVSRNLLKLLKGKVRSKVRRLKPGSSYKVITRTGASGVRGTEFIVSSSLDEDIFAVVEGELEVDNIIWSSLPDFLFTDPLHKNLWTLDPIKVLDFDYNLGAGNAVVVSKNQYTIIQDNLAPIPPQNNIPSDLVNCCKFTSSSCVPEASSLSMTLLGFCLVFCILRLLNKNIFHFNTRK